MSLPDSSMEDIPVPVMVDILSRLPVKTIIHCKCVCKKWLHLLSDSYFANLHLSRSPASLMIYHNIEIDHTTGYCNPGTLTWVEVEDELDHHNLHDESVLSLDLTLAPIFHTSQILPLGSVDGLLCLSQYGFAKDNLYICNPVTREYTLLPRKPNYIQSRSNAAYCFGVASLTREYKLMWIVHGKILPVTDPASQTSQLQAVVYTLGTGQWRCLGRVPYWLRGPHGPFFNGHAHWIVGDLDSPEKLCAFDFEKETFELFPSPPSKSESYIPSLGIINGCLCLCDSYNSKLTVWMMKEYGIKKSWHKEFVIEKSINPGVNLQRLEPLYLINGFRDGTFLMGSYPGVVFVYCPQRKTIVEMEKFDHYFKSLVYRPSFQRLHNFENERVYVFKGQQ